MDEILRGRNFTCIFYTLYPKSKCKSLSIIHEIEIILFFNDEQRIQHPLILEKPKQKSPKHLYRIWSGPVVSTWVMFWFDITRHKHVFLPPENRCRRFFCFVFFFLWFFRMWPPELAHAAVQLRVTFVRFIPQSHIVPCWTDGSTARRLAAASYLKLSLQAPLSYVFYDWVVWVCLRSSH